MAKKKAKESAEPKPRTSLSSEGFFEPFNSDDIPWQRLPGSTVFKRLGYFAGGTQIGVGIDILKPGQYSNRFHYHLREEEHIFILKGSATLVLGSSQYVMRAHGYCCFPAGQRAGHHLFNHTDENCVFMTIGDNHPDDIACFPKTGRARIKATGKTVPLTEV